MLNKIHCAWLGLLCTLTAPVAYADSEPPASDKQCVAETNWFPHEQTPFPDGNEFSDDTSCDFHRWSWQMFLWLTQEENGKPRFLGFDTPYDLLGISDREHLMPRMTKTMTAHSMDEYLQAGTEGILVDQDGRAVYYSQYINPEFVNFMKDRDLTNYKTVQKLAKEHPETTFPINVAEFKASWKIVQPNEDVSGFYTMDSSVYALKNSGGKIVVDDSKSLNVKLALVGFHIAGVVKNHPEMIWATFEHKNNAPNVPSKYSPSTIISDKDWTFYQAKTPFSQCNLNQGGALTLDEATQELSPVTQVCRQFEDGNLATQMSFAVPTNIKVVNQLNESVLGKLNKNDVWSNYFEVSAIWFRQENALVPDMDLQTDVDSSGNQLLIGGLRLSNSTIETFTQSQSTMNNCFRCHNTSQRFPPAVNLDPLPGTNLNISHAFMNVYFWDQELKQAKKAK
ncbi:hypothetical protein L1D15_20165 [Vibrio sp. Isolate25]|uniref:hypothetical protein n=1 Tax=Vibrio sp. Isolate25 TaxID=2908535 RepID=UPI001EFE6D24|nr:hypothetical protein [Vibrio sp. Isolate25]MCG9599010.1 hypothetical protein [Vibrio sp. Isolate25]